MIWTCACCIFTLMVSTSAVPAQGLTEQEAAQRLAADGPNELPSARPRNLLQIGWHVVQEPMFLLLLGAAVIYFLLGDPGEAAILGFFVLVVISITLYQERKTERALEALRDLSSPRATVIRGGEPKRIPAREVVTGDLVILAEGDRTPADAALVEAISLSADESLLTGESEPVRKAVWDGAAPTTRPGGDDLPFVYSGTMIVSGHGIARVTAIGAATEIGRIGTALGNINDEDTLLRRDTRAVVRKVAIIGLGLCLVLLVVFGLTRGDWIGGLLASITMAMAILPEELPMILTIFLALGAWRLSRSRVLTRNAGAIETLGSATVLCVDKTGTLTMNRMAVQRLVTTEGHFDVAPGEAVPLPEAFHQLLELAVLSSDTDPHDPMEMAIRELGRRSLFETEHWHTLWKRVLDYPLSPRMLAVSHAWESAADQALVIATKGSPEAILDLCHVSAEETSRTMAQVRELAGKGLRVLGVARAEHPGPLPREQHDFGFRFLGLLALADEIRPEVPVSVAACHAAGVRVVMITGDHPVTARIIARQVGLPEGEALTGAEMESLADAELRLRVRDVNVFARALPEHKLRLVNALKANGEIVGMTGDGVNDGPALKSAHIGIAMGERGTDVARESADIVLLKDDFASIVDAVRLGRRIFDNLSKAVVYVFAIHIPIAGMSLIPVLAGWPVALLPVHIAFLELIIDPACSVVFEAQKEEEGVMNRPPRSVKARLFAGGVLWWGILQGAGVLVILALVFGLSWNRFGNQDQARTASFIVLTVSNLLLILSNLSKRGGLAAVMGANATFWWISCGTAAFLAVSLYIPFLSGVFHFAIPDRIHVVLTLVAIAVTMVWFSALKALRSRKVPR